MVVVTIAAEAAIWPARGPGADLLAGGGKG